MQKLELSSKFIYVNEFTKELSFCDVDKIKFNALQNYWGNYRVTENKNDYKYNYYNVTDDKHVMWINDYIRDSWNLLKVKENIKSINFKKHFIIQESNESINTHSHMEPLNVINSPDISGIYTVSCGKNSVDLIIKNKAKGDTHKITRIPMKTNNFIFWNSDLDFSLDANLNKEPLVNLVFNFQEKKVV